MSNPGIVNNPQATGNGRTGDPKPDATKDAGAALAGSAPGGVDIEALALKVYALLKQELRIERERSVRN